MRIDDFNHRRGIPLVSKNVEESLESVMFDATGDVGSVFEWACVTTKAHNLAYSILADYFDDLDVPLEVTRRFKYNVVKHLPYQQWTLRGEYIQTWLYSLV